MKQPPIPTFRQITGLVHVKNHRGHRESYQRLFADLLGLTPSTGNAWRRFFRLLAAPYVLFATLDGEDIAFALIALLRAVAGKPTVALFLRPQACFAGGGKSFVKRTLFRMLRHLPRLRVLTILPFEVEPRFRQVAHDWVYDPQLWDLSATGALENVSETPLSAQVRLLAKERQVLTFLGSVNRRKGFHLLVESLAATPGWQQKFFVVIAGKVSADCQAMAKALEKDGALIVDQFVSDNELLSLYPASDLIWCCYDPSYDQASGIFGRAVQFGRVPIVRRDSRIEAMILAMAPMPVSTISLSSGQGLGNSVPDTVSVAGSDTLSRRSINLITETAS